MSQIDKSIAGPPTPIEPSSQFYVKPTGIDQLRHFSRDAFGTYPLIRNGVVAGFLQAKDSPPDWGQGWSGYGERYVSQYGRFVIGTGARYGIAAALHEDAKFYRCNCSGIGPRLRHAIYSSFSARAGRDGHRILSPAPVAAPYVASFTQLTWYPSRYGPKDGFRSGNYGLLYGIAENIAREFIKLNF
ncbi:MAG: hypothetical protein WA755_04065 [Candidatus Acidiferrales bacterium]